MSKTIVLVHGAFADHHAFDAVVPLLERRGYRVLAPDLPGHGDDPTPARDITLDTYVTAITRLVEAQPGPVILVGHSMAGMVVSQVAEHVPAKIARLIYVAGYLPTDGESLQALAESDPTSLIGPALVMAPDYTTASLKPDQVIPAICADVAPAIQRLIRDGQKPEPLAPFQGRVTLTDDRFGQVAKAYLSTTEDRAVTLDLQRRMLAHYPAMRVSTIATSHLPFVARPDELVTALVALAAP